jgi:hypothetical protein
MFTKKEYRNLGMVALTFAVVIVVLKYTKPKTDE